MANLLNDNTSLIYVDRKLLVGKRKIPELSMLIFWASFACINLFYFTYLRETPNGPPYKWHRIALTDFIEDRSCSQLSYVWNFGAPRGCEVTDSSRHIDWANRTVDEDYQEAPTAILLHEALTTECFLVYPKLFYLVFLSLSGFYVVYKYVYPWFGIELVPN